MKLAARATPERSRMRLRAGFAIGLWLLGVVLCGGGVGEVPGLTVLLPVPLVLLGFIGIPLEVAAAIPALVFFSWPAGRRPGASRRRVVGWLLLAGLSAGWLVLAWPYGMKYQGQGHTAYVAGASAVVWLAALLAGMGEAERSPGLRSTLARWLAVGWFFLFAFPYLGELP